MFTNLPLSANQFFECMKSKMMQNNPAQKALMPPQLFRDIRGMIEEARSSVATTVNVGLTMLYWRIGKRINKEVLRGKRAEYGKEILATLSQQLMQEYGNGFSYSTLTRMARFSEAFPKRKIVATLSQTLSWSHFRELLPLEKHLQRDFYAEICRVERWSVVPCGKR